MSAVQTVNFNMEKREKKEKGDWVGNVEKKEKRIWVEKKKRKEKGD